MRYTGCLGWLVAALMAGATLASAQGVTLRDTATGGALSGELLAFDGRNYHLATGQGTVVVVAEGVTCAGVDCPPARFAIGDGAGYPELLPALLEGFALSLGAEVEETGEGIEIRAAGALLAVVSTAGRAAPLTVSLVSDPADDTAIPIALDAVIALRADTTLLDGLTLAQMRRIAAGQVTSWKTVGGADVPINLHAAPLPPGAGAVVAAAGLGLPPGLALADHPRVVDASDAVANDPFGLAFLPLSALRAAQPLALTGDCGLAIRPDDFTVKTGAWPFTYPVSVVSSGGDPTLFAREFLGFLTSPMAQNIIADFGLSPLAISSRGLDRQGQRIANAVLAAGQGVTLEEVQDMIRGMSGARRLSATFRFGPADGRLDPGSRTVATALARALMLGEHADKVIRLAGFAQGEATPAADKARSAERADTVRRAIMEAAPSGALADVLFEVEGHGAASPLICPQDARADRVNNRVEVWVRDRAPGRAE